MFDVDFKLSIGGEAEEKKQDKGFQVIKIKAIHYLPLRMISSNLALAPRK